MLICNKIENTKQNSEKYKAKTFIVQLFGTQKNLFCEQTKCARFMHFQIQAPKSPEYGKARFSPNSGMHK